jgi:hypothetical protein
METDKQETTQLAKSIQANGRGLVLSSIEDMYRFAKCVAQSGLAPSSFRTPEQVVIALQTGAELGMPPMRSLQSFCVVNGQARLWGDTPLALVRQSGQLEYIKEWLDGEGENMVAHCETKRKGDPEPKVTTFSVEDAKAARLWMKRGPKGDSTWITYPKRMLQYRARSFNLRDNFPDCFGGASIAEEYEGITPPTESPTPQVAPREERKQAEGVVITDSKQVVETALEGLLNLFYDYAKGEFALNVDDEVLKGVPGAVFHKALSLAAVCIFHDDVDYRKVGAYTIEKIGIIKAHLEQNGIPEQALDIIREALNPPTAEEVEQNAAEKLSSYKYACQHEPCQAVFDEEPNKAKNGKMQCPVCLKFNVKETETVGVEQ